MHIWVDADACPAVIKDILYRAAERTKIGMTLVANKYLRTPPSPYIRALQVPRGFDVAIRRRTSQERLATALADFEQLDFEDERGVGRDDAAATVLAVGERGRDDELALAADLHAGDALVPALDDV